MASSISIWCITYIKKGHQASHFGLVVNGCYDMLPLVNKDMDKGLLCSRMYPAIVLELHPIL